MNFKKSHILGAAFVTILVLSSTAVFAAPVFYFNDPVADRNTFQSATTNLSTESFEDAFLSGNNLSFATGSPQAFTVTSDTLMLQESYSRFVSDGSAALGFSEYPSATLTFTFDTPVYAFGIDVNDMNFGTMSYSDNLGNSLIRVLDGDNGTSAGGQGFQNLQFFGLTNTESFSSVQLSFSNSDSQLAGTISVDRLEYQTTVLADSISLDGLVPVPASVWLFSSGLFGLIGVARRKARN